MKIFILTLISIPYMIALIVQHADVIKAFMIDHGLIVGVSCIVLSSAGCFGFARYWEMTGKYEAVKK